MNAAPPVCNDFLSALQLLQSSECLEAEFKYYIDLEASSVPSTSYFLQLQMHYMSHFHAEIFNQPL